jgi:aspartyl aminopeptidase
MMLPSYPSSPEAAKRFLAFVNASPTPFHAVHNASAQLETSGFKKVSQAHKYQNHLDKASQIREADDWEKTLQPRGKYYFTR